MYNQSIHQSINHVYCIIALITEETKDKENEEKMYIWTTTITKCMILLF